ncbi:anaerobic ribonucleoside-triphosphate reductase activating protein [Candidatus Kuenenbacteria bacterium]|nr:anaerobic ribonucleoside-triphosphate reductase activating protein [Candidatus Kuenenbacteria bacterium]
MLFGGIQKISLIDYPDKICAIIFTQGCNFRCKFCYNPELVQLTNNNQQLTIMEGEIFEFLKKRKGLIDGVCVTGGEPTLHKDLPEFLAKIKKMGFLIKLDTNGTNPKMLKKLIDKKLIDYLAMDIKAPLENQKSKIKNQNDKSKFKNHYKKVVGVKVDLKKIKESVKIIKNSGIDYEFRTTIAPGLHKEEDILQIAREISPAKKYFLQQFVPSEKMIDEKYKKVKPYPIETLKKMRDKARRYVGKVEVRN